MRLVQFLERDGRRRVGTPLHDGSLQLLDGVERVIELALMVTRTGDALDSVVVAHLSESFADYDRIALEGCLLPPVDHPDAARCLVTLTGLTHLGSAESRDKMHSAMASGSATDSIRMFGIGMAGGKPPTGEIGAEPEWAYKGDGRCLVAPGHPLTCPGFAHNGGEEAEIAGIYVIDDYGTPWRIGFAIGNEFSDHVLEKENYLYLAHSKLRQCSIGPELLVGELPSSISGTINIFRNDQTIWSSPFESGESKMCHSIANLEHHHFKYSLFRRPGDLHVHFFGASVLSFQSGIRCQDGDLFEISVPAFGRALRNHVQFERDNHLVQVRSM
jgi:hypothetical protein